MINYSTGWSALLEPGHRIIKSHEHAYRFPTTPGLSTGGPTPGFLPQKKFSTSYLGEVFLCPGPYSSGMATAALQSSLGCSWRCQSPAGNLHYMEQKQFRTPWEALKQCDILSNLIQFHIFCQLFQILLSYEFGTSSLSTLTKQLSKRNVPKQNLYLPCQ